MQSTEQLKEALRKQFGDLPTLKEAYARAMARRAAEKTAAQQPKG